MQQKQGSGRDDNGAFDIDEALKTSDAIIDILFKWQREIFNFYGHRLKQYADLPARMAQCQNPKDLHALQSQFFDTLFSDYRKKAEELFELTRKLTGEAAAPEENHYEKAILKAQEDGKQLLRQAKSNAEKIIRDAEATAEKILKEAPRTKGKVA